MRRNKSAFTRDTTPIRGKGAWVWYVSQCGGTEAMIAKAQDLGLEWLAVKCGDGAGLGDQHNDEVFMGQFEEALEPAHNAGLRLLSWSYNYLDDPMAEAATARYALDIGSDGHIFDVESECKGKPDAALWLGEDVRGEFPRAFLGYAPLPVASLHRTLPYRQFNVFCDAVLPQFYTLSLGRGEYSFQRLFAEWRRSTIGLGNRPMLVPVVDAYRPEVADVWPRIVENKDVVASIRSYGPQARRRHVPGVSFWRLDTIVGPIADAVRELRL